MKILVTGANGFIARNISKHLETKHTIIKTNRHTLNVLNQRSVTEFLTQNDIEIIIHAAVSGGRRTKIDDLSVLVENLQMFNNLSANRDKFKMLIHFGSGAEYDKRYDIISATENQESNPVDYYGLSKKIIKREIDKLDNFYNLRIFGCFGSDELANRFIKSAIRNAKEDKEIVIHQDRYMDFISIDDVCTAAGYYVNNFNKKILQKDINLCYTTRVSLSDIAKTINKLLGKPMNNMRIEYPGFSTEYSGDGTKLANLDLNLEGLEKGIQKVINEKQ